MNSRKRATEDPDLTMRCYTSAREQPNQWKAGSSMAVEEGRGW